ncbi:GGDEF domain-containing protein [Litorilituus lipolyticus]|uniref:diguanylate cyclase n=1 Tax=Litorilituus lipolyticus TaxID=2491017 RepID=A0A502KYY4_9GAMM|nr:GGDEF domain-containing protein [Litorilituus lipolyticus]TPH15739.1 GGDEF domain-containing protein [Litorilituus lipolyticus]
MHFDPLATQLLIFIGLLTGTASLAWGVLTYPLGIAPQASARYALANTLVTFGLILSTYRDTTTSYLFWYGADLCVLSGFILLKWGTQQLFKLRSSIRIDSILLLSIGLIMLLTMKPNPSSNIHLGILFSIATFIIFSQLAFEHFSYLKKANGSVIVLIPIVSIACIFLLRAFLLFFAPQSEDQLASITGAEAVPMLWTYVVLTLAINIIMFGNAITRLVDKIRSRAEKDYLTGLMNRRAILLHQERVHNFWLRDNVVYSLILFDLDYFKKINDEFGHAAGDAVLLHVANSLQKVIRVTDTFSRYGGEEFLLLLPATNEEEVLLITKKLKETLSESSLHWHGKLINITASFGCATIEKNDSQQELINRADIAMYKAKSEGRNCYCQAISSTKAESCSAS